MSILSFIIKWDPTMHGSSSNETSYINFMKTKFIIISTIWQEEYDNETFDEVLNWFNIYKAHGDIKLCVIKKMYRYRGRDFAIENFGINKIQKLWRNYYTKKIIFMKSIKNLKYREIHGKYPKSKFIIKQ